MFRTSPFFRFSSVGHFLNWRQGPDGPTFWVWLRWFLLVGAFMSVVGARAADVVTENDLASIRVNVAEVRDTPSGTGAATALLARFTPVRVLASAGQSAKIRDVWGKIGWVRVTDLDRQNLYALAAQPVTPVYKTSGGSVVAYEITRDVAVRVLAVSNGWLTVEHPAGGRGYLPTNAVLPNP